MNSGRRIGFAMALAVLAVAAAVVSWLAIAAHSRSVASDPPVQPLADLAKAIAALPARASAARIVGLRHYAPVAPAVRSTSDRLPSDVLLSAAAIEQRARRQPDADTLDALGVALLVTGAHDRAVGALERAVRAAPQSAVAHAHLGAAYLTGESERDRPEDLPSALASTVRALRLDPRLLAGWFNRALALEALRFRAEAERAWLDYLARDDDSAWANEARQHLQAAAAARAALAAPVPGRPAIDDALEGTFADWVAHAIAGGNEAGALAPILALARTRAASHDDRFLEDLVEQARTVAGDSRRGAALLAGARAYAAGRRHHRADRLTAAGIEYRRAAAALAESGSPLVWPARMYVALSTYYEGRTADASRQLEAVVAAVQDRPWPLVRAEVFRRAALFHRLLGEFDRARARYAAAVDAAEQGGDASTMAGALAEAAQVSELLQDAHQAWHQRLRALAISPDSLQPPDRHLLFVSGSAACVSLGLPEAALAFDDAAAANARQWNNAGAIAEAALYRARTEIALGDRAAARADVHDAREALDGAADRMFAARWLPDITALQAQLTDDPAQSIAAYRSAIDAFVLAGRRRYVPRLDVEMARRLRASGRGDDAEAALRHGADVFEREWQTIVDPVVRAESFADGSLLYAELADYLAAAGDTRRSLAVVERARGRALGNDSRPVQPSDVDTLVSGVAPDVALLHFSIGVERMTTWIVRRGVVDVRQTPMTPDALAARVQALRSGVEDRDGRAFDAAAAGLYDLLIRPVAALLPPASVVMIVPDGVLHALPFAALRDPETGQYFVEQHALGIAPNGLHLLTTPPRASDRDRAIVFANPESGGATRALAGTSREGARIARIYPHTTMFVGADATKARFLDTLGRYPIVHFGGHATPNVGHPELSRLHLSENRREASVYMSELRGRTMTTVDLIVLAGCRTGVGRTVAGEGPLNLARPFLEAGAGSVVATLWDIDDGPSEELFAAFHEGYRRGASPVDALRQAQLRMLRSPVPALSHPRAWAAAQALGNGSRAGGR